MASYNFNDEARATDEELVNELKSLSELSAEKIAELLPKRTDQEKLKALIAAVNEESSANRKREVLMENLATASDLVKQVVKGFIKVAI